MKEQGILKSNFEFYIGFIFLSFHLYILCKTFPGRSEPRQFIYRRVCNRHQTRFVAQWRCSCWSNIIHSPSSLESRRPSTQARGYHYGLRCFRSGSHIRKDKNYCSTSTSPSSWRDSEHSVVGGSRWTLFITLVKKKKTVCSCYFWFFIYKRITSCCSCDIAFS